VDRKLLRNVGTYPTDPLKTCSYKNPPGSVSVLELDEGGTTTLIFAGRSK